MEFVQLLDKGDDELIGGGRGSQARGSKGLLQVLVPAVTYWLEHHYETVLRKSRVINLAIHEYDRLKQYVTPTMMAHIACTCTLDALGRGSTFKTKITTLKMNIGQHLEDQAFMEYMNQADPKDFKKLQKYYLHDPIRRYDKKVYAMKHVLNNHDTLKWEWMDDKALGSIGALLLRAVMSIPADEGSKEGFFERKTVRESATKSYCYLGLSKTGMKYRDKLTEAANRLAYKPLPMLCEPQQWSMTQRGGYLLHPPRKYADLIHGHSQTEPSQTAIDALNRLQSVPYRINTYILDLQKELVKTTNEIGSFRSYESDSWKDEHFPLVDSDWLNTLEKSSDEYKREMRKLTKAYHQQRLDEKEAINPRRIIYQAEELRNDVFYSPWYFDSRLRLYPICELGVTRGDFVKALLISANPSPITDKTEEELLIAIATAGDFGKISKKSYADRLLWSTHFVKSDIFKRCVSDPVSNRFWQDADEAFEFLSYCEEYNALFIDKTRDKTRVFVGRDMSCSGIQFLSSLIGNEKGMRFTNVIPGDEPRDAYEEVARLARQLLNDKQWVQDAVNKREEKRLVYNKANPDTPRKKRMHIKVDPYEITRKVVKTQVMVTGYGGTYLSKREYIIEALKELIEEKKATMEYEDFGIIVDACIQGMRTAFPEYSNLNDWFKDVARLACKGDNTYLTWVSPNGSIIAQDYREPKIEEVRTYAANGGNYLVLKANANEVLYLQTGLTDEIRSSKHASAIAANFVHSLDSCMIQDGTVQVDPSIPLFTCHDCVYLPPGYVDQVMPLYRKAFHNVVTTPVLQSLLEENGIEGQIELLPNDGTDPALCLDSPYMFS